MEPVKWGIISTAHINRLVIPGAKASPKVDLVAVASRDQGRADEYARRWGISRAYGSYEALLADPEIEAVYISLPNNLHCEWSIRSFEAGKHVLCEKPLSRRADEAEAAFDAAERGALMDVGCYCVNGSRLLAGEPENAFGQAWYGPSGTDWVFGATLRFGGDVIGVLDCGTALTERDELEAIGSEGSLFVDDPWHCNKPGIELRRDDGVERIEVERADSYRLELENVSAAIRGEGDLLLGRDDAVAQARALEALHRSATTGEAVSLPRL